MAAAKKTSGAHFDDNLETFSLLWLDANANTTEENKHAQKRLRSVINHVKIFHDLEGCKKYIKSRSSQDRIVLISSGGLGKELVPRIHALQQLSSIYIYCRDRNTHKIWTNNFNKVKAVVVDLDDLVDKIKKDQKSREKVEEPMILNIYNASSNLDKSTTDLNGNFIHYLLLIDVLIRMKYSENNKKKLIEVCKDKYADNVEELELIREFDRKYRPSKALWWYTCDGFLYKTLNKALRIQNTELLFLFRFVIRDIFQQLKENQCRKPIQVYRYQIISNDELRNLQRSRNQFISINSFLSTSLSRDIALSFSKDVNVTHGFERVLFTIDADSRVKKSKPYADISQLSCYTQECEVLFMVGCIFRLVDVQRDEKHKLWIINMQLAGDDQNESKDLFNKLKDEYGCGENEADLLSYGNVLQSMGQYDLAEKIFTDLRERCTTDETSYYHLCYSLGIVHKERKDFDRSLRWFQRALDRKVRVDPNDYIYIAGLHCSIGNIHAEKKDYTEAMKCYNKAFQLYQNANVLEHEVVASLRYGIGCIHLARKNYSDALACFKKSLAIQENNLPTNHPDMAMNYSGMGDVYFSIADYQNAMENYMHSLKIRKKSLHPKHQLLASNNKSIGKVFEAFHKWNDALAHYQKASYIYQQTLALDHSEIVEIKADIDRVLNKLK